MIDDIIRFIGSPWFSILNQIVMAYVWFRLGRTNQRIKSGKELLLLSMRVDTVAIALEIKDAHIAALTAQLEEARKRG